MSAFEVKLTPTRGQPKRRSESREPTLVLLGPFTPKATVIFEGVPVGKTARRQLFVKNPYDGTIKVLVTKLPKPEINLALEWTSTEICSGEERLLELVWNPNKAFAKTEILQLSDNCGNKKDIVLIFKAVETRKTVKTSKQASIIPKKLKLKSPSPPKTIVKRSVLMKTRGSPIKISYQSPSPIQSLPKVRPLNPSNASNLFSSSIFDFSIASGERVEYNKKVNKENVSPGTPENASKVFNSIKFTPSDNTNISYLADLPTPVNFSKLARKRISLSPISNQYCYEHDISQQLIPSEQSVLALKETPKSVNRLDRIGTINEKFTLTPQTQQNILHEKKDFDPNCFSTITKDIKLKAAEIHEDVYSDINRQLNFSYEFEFNEMKDSPKSASVKAETLLSANDNSPCNEIQLVFLNSLDAALDEQPKVLNKTQTVSLYDSHPQLSMIAEESSRDLGITYHTNAAVEHEPEELKIHQKTFHITSMIKSSSDDNIIKNLTMDIKNSTVQGSMPNLNGEEDEEARMFVEHEIRAQSSRFNLHEIDQTTDELKSSKCKRQLNSEKDEALSMLISPPKKSKLTPPPSLAALPTISSSWTGPKIPTKSRSINQKERTSFQIPKSVLPRNLSLKRTPTTLTVSKKFNAEEKRVFLYDSDHHLKTLINPDPFAATTTCDPFLTATMYLDERCFEKYERQLKKWLNALVTIPADLDTEPSKPVDVGKLFDEVKCKELTLAPTKELISSNYYKNRLNQLRNSGISLYFSEQVAAPLRKIRSAIEKKSMVLRTDRDLHLDLVLQRNILELLLCFNPLWLRLGLEVTFGEQIELQSNRDVVGLSTFIINRLFRDRYLEAKNSRAYNLSASYSDHMKKFTFRMFLFLLFFLDTAKSQRLIKHNPCLFVRTAPYKETREILIRFSSHLIAGIGDITKHLKRFGYVLTHKQTFLDEFDYAFENLAVDLRDGIRLTRVMEIILLKDDLTQSLRVPSISRLQKIHNVNLALKALEEADYQIAGDITAKDICDGHREKTLSLLWQIVYKFRSPKFKAAANVIRAWWRNNWLKVVIGRRIVEKKQKRMEAATTKIQAFYRAYRARQHFKNMRLEKLRAVVVMQKYTRRFLAQKHAALQYSSILRIQRWWRLMQYTKSVRERFLLQRKSAILIQTSFRRHLLAKRLLAASDIIYQIQVEARLRHEKAIIIQRAMKSYTTHKKLQSIVMGMVAFNRRKALKYRAASRIQALVRMRKVRLEYQRLRNAAITIQRRWRETLLARNDRLAFLKMRRSAITIQMAVKGYFLMKQDMASYEEIRKKITFIQRKFRAKSEMMRQQTNYIRLKQATLVIQQRYRALIEMRCIKNDFLRIKWATVVLQQRYRAQRAMQSTREQFISLKHATVTIQQHFRALIAMKQCYRNYERIKSACITIQQRWRATIAMRQQRIKFLAVQYYTIYIQRQFRANITARNQRKGYLKLKSAAICIQKRFRATLLTREIQNHYRTLRKAAIHIQRYWRNHLMKRRTRENYLAKRTAAIKIQNCFRGYVLTKQTRNSFVNLRLAVTLIQQKYRATLRMQEQKRSFQTLVKAALVFQRQYRAILIARKQKADYVRLREATICIQRHWRAFVSMRKCHEEYKTLRKSVVNIQIQYRAIKSMKIVRLEYQRTRAAAVLVQQKYRAKREMERVCGQYLNLKSATIVIQQYFRGYLEMKLHRASFVQTKLATYCLQQRFRALKAMKTQRRQYLHLKSSACTIQRWFRSYLVMKHCRTEFVRLKNACIVIQTRYRAKIAMTIESHQYERLRFSALKIQQRWRAVLNMRHQCSEYQRILKAVCKIQTFYRAYRLRLLDQCNYRIYRSAVIVVQRQYRANIQMRSERSRFLLLKTTTLRLQCRIRGFLARQAFQAKLTPEYLNHRQQELAARRIQTYWRGYCHRKRYQTPLMRDIAHRMIASRREAIRDPSNRVTNILRSCMKFMKTRFAVHEAIKVLLRIEHISRLVPHLLTNDSIFLASFCYMTMAQAIRSELDKQLIEICARIILNMARFEGTKEEAFQENGLITVSQMLLRWCDKECGIFNTLCTLLWVLSHDAHKKNAIRSYMISREAIFMLRETRKLVQRKENMRKNVKKPVGCLVPPDPILLRMEPILAPDYGVIRSKPYVFYSSVFAFETVLNVLDVDIS
ncbi:protein abnormal spindle [Malaya genurostris]|uniref:protein abnormal spindle n=1 Tax=Malaya genurostris TaxID=325434 RepID=UPI0026F3808C|nr:protein abnormal spindle [Malaya genurostris]